jgi:hypothetical protein
VLWTVSLALPVIVVLTGSSSNGQARLDRILPLHKLFATNNFRNCQQQTDQAILAALEKMTKISQSLKRI